MAKEIYVIVAENDQPHIIDGEPSYRDDQGPLVFEQYTRKSSLCDVANKIVLLQGKYGKCRIAKLVFLDEENTDEH